MSNETNPVKVIRRYCLEVCGGGSAKNVTECQGDKMITPCPLYPFRQGKNPYRAKRVMTEEQKALLRENFNKRKSSQ